MCKHKLSLCLKTNTGDNTVNCARAPLCNDLSVVCVNKPWLLPHQQGEAVISEPELWSFSPGHRKLQMKEMTRHSELFRIAAVACHAIRKIYGSSPTGRLYLCELPQVVESSQGVELLQRQHQRLVGRRVHEVEVNEVVDACGRQVGA